MWRDTVVGSGDAIGCSRTMQGYSGRMQWRGSSRCGDAVGGWRMKWEMGECEGHSSRAELCPHRARVWQ